MRIPDLYLERKPSRSLRSALVAHDFKTKAAGLHDPGSEASGPGSGRPTPRRCDDTVGTIPLGPAGKFWIAYAVGIICSAICVSGGWR